MLFINYKSQPFADLNKTPTTLLSADANTLLVNSLIVCNLGKQTIRFNLKKVRTQTTTLEVFVFSPPGLEIPPADSTKQFSGTVDVLKEMGVQLILEYSATPSIVDSLVCYSNGTTQKFDCDITYAKLNEVSYAG